MKEYRILSPKMETSKSACGLNIDAGKRFEKIMMCTSE
jgi:hypothetical protein